MLRLPFLGPSPSVCQRLRAHVYPSLSNAFLGDAAIHLLHPGTSILFCGFNCALDARRDVQGSSHGRSTWNDRELSRLISYFRLTDAWVHLHANVFEATWSRGLSASRLARIYVPQALYPRVDICKAVYSTLTSICISDHREVLSELRLSCTLVLRPWCFDGRILRDPVKHKYLGAFYRTPTLLLPHHLRVGISRSPRGKASPPLWDESLFTGTTSSFRML